MKIVVNKCYGGFGVSVAVLKELVARGSDAIEICTPRQYYGGDNEKYHGTKDWMKRWAEDFAQYKSIGDGFKSGRNEFNIYKDDLIYSLKSKYDNELRTNKDLIEVIESIGVEKSSASLAKLAIIEVPDGIEWEIDDYDGIETIREKHRSW